MTTETPRLRGMSLRYKLPLLITGLLVLILAAGMFFAYAEVRLAAVEAAQTRLELVSEELASVVAPGIARQLDTLQVMVREPALLAHLDGTANAADSAAAREVLAKLRAANQPNAPILLLRPNRTVAFAIDASAVPTPLPVDRLTGDGFSPFFQLADSVGYWISAPIGDPGAPRGYIGNLRFIRDTGEENPVQSLLGGEAELLLGNASTGGPWVSLQGVVVEPPEAAPFDGPADYDDAAGEEYLVHTSAVASVPWQIVARAPARAVLARPMAFARRAILTVVLLALAGASGAWLLSSRITRPIGKLRAASEAIGAGNYERKVDVERSDEFGLLADAFNRMSERIRTAHAELRQQYETASALAQELHRANRAKSEFLATMSHEVRTPINAILGYTDLLLLGVNGPVNETQLEQLERIRVSGRHLVSLVDQVLDLARIESGKLQMEPKEANAATSIETAVTVLQLEADAKRLHLSVECDEADAPLYFGDPQRVDQILVNLLGNAIKFTEAGAAVVIRCDKREQTLEAQESPGKWACISVCDTGPGIDPEQRERIFDAFVQVDSGYTRRYGGAGLGLAISRQLARAMGGDVTVESVPGQGSSFTLWLPAEARTFPDSPPAHEESRSATPANRG